MDKHEKIIRDAQYRKGLSIAFFNATNNATEIVKLRETKSLTNEEIQDQIKFWRDWLLDEHKGYYAENIASVGKIYETQDVLKRLNEVKDYEGLRSIWVTLTEDQRRDGDIKNKVKEIKEKYEGS